MLLFLYLRDFCFAAHLCHLSFLSLAIFVISAVLFSMNFAGNVLFSFVDKLAIEICRQIFPNAFNPGHKCKRKTVMAEKTSADEIYSGKKKRKENRFRDPDSVWLFLWLELGYGLVFL